jgi:NodT family efflux transporter outer membrane factor (OMF) lipoprotein
MVGANYKPPKTDVPAKFSESFNGTTATQPSTRPVASVDVTRWWEAFNDATLNSLVDRATRNNLDLRVATARIVEARAQRGVSGAGLWPEVDLGGRYTHNRQSRNGIGIGNSGGATGAGGSTTSIPLFSRESNLYQVGFDSTWELDVFGGIRRGIEAANADIQSAIENRRDVLVTLLGDVARNYVELRGAQRQLAITNDNLRAQQETLELTRQRFRAGLTSELDVVRAQAQVESTASQVPTLEAQVRQSIHQLGLLTGQPPGALSDELTPAQPLPISAPAPDVPVGLPSDLLRRRPDVRRAERNLAGATARVGEAVADYFPRFSLTGSYGLQSQKSQNLFNYKDSNYWSIGPSARWPILDWGRIRSNVAVQNARTEQALAQYQSAVLQSLKDVEDALISYDRERQRWVVLNNAVAANRRAVELSNELYSRGLIDFLSVLEAQRDLFASESQLVQSETAVSSNVVALYKALGGGWENWRE